MNSELTPLNITEIVSDVLISLSYFAIPLEIFYFQKLLPNPFKYRIVIWLFEMFIFACGTTHFVGSFKFSYNVASIMVLTKVLTAIVSFITAILLIRVFPLAFSLQNRNMKLEEEIGLREENERELIKANASLLRFRRIVNRIRSSLDENILIDTAVREIRREFAADVCLIAQKDSLAVAEGTFKVRGISFKTLKGSIDTLSLNSLNENKDASFMNKDEIRGIFGLDTSVKSGLFIRLKDSQNCELGIMFLLNYCYVNKFDEIEMELLHEVAIQISIALDQAISIEKERQSVENLKKEFQRNELLNKEKNAAEMTSKMTADFLATMSHEIRTPLNAIIGFGNILQQQSLTEEQQEILEMITSSSNLLLNLINDILDYSKIESGFLSLEDKEFSLVSSVERVIMLNSQHSFSKNIQLNMFIDPSVPIMINGDETRLKQVLNNFINNAIKFTDTGEVIVTIATTEDYFKFYDFSEWKEFHVLAANNHNVPRLYFRIIDTGIGIAEESLPNLFQKFKQVDSSITRRFGGTGLGLAISFKLVEIFHGSLSVSSLVGKGSAFSFSISLGSNPGKKWTENPAFSKKFSVAIVSPILRTRQSIEHILTCLEYPFKSFSSISEYSKSTDTYRIVLVDETVSESHLDNITIPENCMLLVNSSSTIPVTFKQRFVACLTKPLRYTNIIKIFSSINNGNSISLDKAAHLSRSSLFEKKLHILVVDDNAINRKVIAKLLESILCPQIDFAEDGAVAVKLALSKSYDIVFMDVSMPVMDGLTATRLIKKEKKVFIVAMTANALYQERLLCMESGMDDYLAKPVSRDDVISLLERFLKRL
ncbi:hypothetical protein ROZALSC1DRAFT_26862 [Rozella allomycis CSF55]|uniref:histidine kinase n=2 Tax=Rozella allomycis TaxID=281847 RepID=A0A075AXS5_ROZAC|nr:putative ethylene receptor 1 [Rozella allomycis]EPZ33527.1 Signal transduction response regulator, receiver domain-containing protein [Rozella allomycis CSF55]RKP21755.1 hypothetical protein ROZALSC1DRAFT_26862 [Rozella allomycis CSF55]|eukprot:EPZ33527.1 Signal transduction response regulator, receiver domain-containing protein [Rozella allomycis CSF55]